MIAADEIIKRCPAAPIVGAEVGVWFGLTSARLLRGLPLLHLYMIDWYKVLEDPADRNKCSVNACIGQSAGQMGNARQGAMDGTTFAGERRTMIVADFLTAIEAIKAPLHFAFLDADHTYEGTRDAINAYWTLIEEGGFLCGHDYGHPSPDWGVAEAVHEFSKAQSLPFELGADGTWFVRKPEGFAP